MGWEGASMSIPGWGGGGGGGGCKSVVLSVSLALGVSALVLSAYSLSCQILVLFEAHWPMKAFPSSTC